MLAHVVDGMLDSAEDNYRSLREARGRPHVLDDATVNRVVEVYTTQSDDLWLYEEQFSRWKKETLTAQQRGEVERLSSQLERLRAVVASVLSLAGELKDGTIEKVLAKDDVELAIDLLSGEGEALIAP